MVNKFTIPHQYSMPHIESEMHKLAGSIFFAKCDFSHEYWQLPLDPTFQNCQYFLTPDVVYKSTRVLHGTTNSVAHLQPSLATEVPAELRHSWIHWLNDIPIHSDTPERLVNAVNLLLKMRARLDIHLHPSKCLLFRGKCAGPVAY